MADEAPSKNRSEPATHTGFALKKTVKRKKKPIRRDIFGNPIDTITASNPTDRLMRRTSEKTGPIPPKRPVKKEEQRKRILKETETQRIKQETKENVDMKEILTEEERLKREQEAKTLRLEKEKKNFEEQEKKRLEEEERKKKEEEKIRFEKEAEARRFEEEKIRQEKERQHIIKKIEIFKLHLNPEEKKLAHTIASEMIRRDIRWNGYITLHGGIGGAMLTE